MKVNNVLGLIGNTPHVRINNLFGSDHEVWIKLKNKTPVQVLKTGLHWL
jgi:cysteine synthase A